MGKSDRRPLIWWARNPPGRRDHLASVQRWVRFNEAEARDEPVRATPQMQLPGSQINCSTLCLIPSVTGSSFSHILSQHQGKAIAPNQPPWSGGLCPHCKDIPWQEGSQAGVEVVAWGHHSWGSLCPGENEELLVLPGFSCLLPLPPTLQAPAHSPGEKSEVHTDKATHSLFVLE